MVRSVLAESVELIEPPELLGVVDMLPVLLDIPLPPLPVVLPEVPVLDVSLVPVPVVLPGVVLLGVELLVIGLPVDELLDVVSVVVAVDPPELELFAGVVAVVSLLVLLVPLLDVCAATGSVQAAATAITRTLCLKLFMLTPSGKEVAPARVPKLSSAQPCPERKAIDIPRCAIRAVSGRVRSRLAVFQCRSEDRETSSASAPGLS